MFLPKPIRHARSFFAKMRKNAKINEKTRAIRVFRILTFSPTIFPYAPLYLLPIRGKTPFPRLHAEPPPPISTPLQPKVAAAE